MRSLILVVLAASTLFAQETRQSHVNPSPNPADDAKANTDQVPDVYAITGHLEPGTEVFTFAIVTIGVMNDVDFHRLDDKSYR